MITHHHKQPVLLLVVALILLLFLQLGAEAAELFALPSSAAAGAASSCLPGQAAALLRLKRSFAATNASVGAFASWRAGTDCCGWAGVLCGGGGGGVTSLDLGGRGLLSAALDPAIFGLTSLRYLNLAHNNFNLSEIPSAGFERLTHLTHLNLSNANFSGEIPADSIGRLANLVSIDLSAASCCPLYVSNLESLIANLKNLRELRLGSAGIFTDEEAVAELWCNTLAKYAPNLRVLSLPFCLHSRPPTICDSFSALRSLALLDLRDNGLYGPLPDFLANLSSLRVLQLSGNNLTGRFPSIILQQTNLVTLHLHDNPEMSGNLPTTFPAGSSLESLLLWGTCFSGKIPSSIGNLKSLKELALGPKSFDVDTGSTGFSGTLPSSIGMLRSLESLALSGFELVGSITSWIGNLTSLTILQILDCGLSGPIPSSVGELKKLKELTLINCKFNGRLPSSIGELKMLEQLTLYNCNFYGSIPSSIGELKMLKELTLSHCNFYGSIPSSLSNLTQLDTVNLQSNKLSGTVQLSLFLRLPNLSTLSLSDNNLFVVDGEDYNSSLVYPKINFLGLMSCGMVKLPKVLRHLGHSDSTWVDVSQNRIRGAIPQWAWENWSGSHFEYLNLSHNYFTSFAGLEAFLPFSIASFDLSSNMFEGPIPLPRNLNQHSGLQLDYSSNMFSSMPLNFSIQTLIFKASRNNLSGNILPYFCGINNIMFLDLSYNNLAGSVPSCLMEGTNGLQVLNLRKNRIHGELPHNISESCTLEVLDFGGNEIKGKLPRSLASCKNLEVLNIQNNQISDSFPCWMSTHRSLGVLVLRSNKFFGHLGPSTAQDKNSCEFRSIRVLDLASNNFSGTLREESLAELMVSIMAKDESDRASSWEIDGQVPAQPYQVTIELTYKGSDRIIEKVLRTLVFLDVSNNAFQGSIPAAIGDLVSLNMLNMSYNSFIGPIPSHLGNLAQLESLDLSSNELSGEIPRELALLDSLAVLNLSNNKLVGSVPQSPHFLTFSNSSFLGNDGLCGPPLSKGCVNSRQSVVHSEKNSVDIMLFLFSGIGFGVGFAIAIVVAWGIPIRKRA